MKVLLHCTYFPPEVGGLESHVAELARGLVQAGHEVRVVSSLSMPGLPAEEVVDGVRIRRTALPSRSGIGWALHALGSLPVTRRWARWADIVHAQAFASIFPCALAAGSAGRPLVATFHTSHFLVRARRALWRPVLAWLVRRPAHSLAASKELAEVAMGLAPGVEVEALTNGVDTGRFRRLGEGEGNVPPLGEGERRILVPRRLFEKNGVEYFVRAMPAILQGEPGVRAWLVGDGPERGRLESLAAELKLGQSLRFLGRRTHDEMPAILSSGELAVFPSLMEATSVAALECMACELPVVATRVGGLPEIVDESVGRLVPPGDPGALAQAVLDLLRTPELRAMGSRARERVVSAWSNERLVARHVEVYRALGANGAERMEPGEVRA
ncbi:MAG: glycosyltransferase family 4 protein [Gemmatimonadota bacterium]